MMRVFYLFKIIIVSPEFVALAVLALITYLRPEGFIWLSSKINTTNDMIKFLALLSPGLTSLIVSQRSELLSPQPNDLSSVLLNWPDYHKIEYRFWICLSFGTLGSFFCIYVLLFGNLTNYIMLAIFICGITISSISYLTFLNATITLKRIISTMIK